MNEARWTRRRTLAGLGGLAGVAGLQALGACTSDQPPAPGEAAAASWPPDSPAAGPASAAAEGSDAPTQGQRAVIAPLDDPPPAPRELRGAWVATVANIDWPSRPGLAAAEQRAEALALLNRAQALHLNLLVLQVRPAGDAIYPSSLEPWTEYLGGAQGRAPWLAGEAPWDPLAFWLQEARARAIELHVWFNPYRARHATARSPLVAPHIGVREPALVRRYGDMLWMDPGEPAAAEHTLAVVADLLRRYDVDGAHIDDYFYPYPVPVNPSAPPGGPDRPFPDAASYGCYRAGGGTLALADWRRANVDGLVERLQAVVHATRPGTRFGISPFGLPRPDRRPAGIAGFSQYDQLYADVERWVEQGWFDYLVPQLYWPRDRPGQEFGTLLAHWQAEVAERGPAPTRHHWPGLFTSQVRRDPAAAYGLRVWPADEITGQVRLMRAQGTAGHIHFSMIALAQDRDGVASKLAAELYTAPALVPASPWLDARVPAAPQLQRAGDTLLVGVADSAVPVARWALWRRVQGRWRFDVRPGAVRVLALEGADAVALSAISRTGVEGPRVRMELA